MTWHAQSGQIVLQGEEAKLFRDAILYMCDIIVGAVEDEESFFDGASVFDRMSRSQQLASLEVVARYLFHQTPECLPLTAWSEATLASVLHEIRTFVHLEIDEGDSDAHRRTILDMLNAHDDIEDMDSLDEWNCLLDAYEDRFLWDLDYEDDDVTDLPPEHSRRTRLMMGIAHDYYSSIPHDLRADESLQHGAKRVWMVIDGKKRFRLTVTLTCELPASSTIETIDDDLTVLSRICPHMTLLRVDSAGDLVEASDEQHAFFFDGALLESGIEEVPDPETN